MTKQDAIKAAYEGKRISHNYFSPDEWIEVKKGELITEDGYYVIDEFWDIRSGGEWETGWYIKEK